MGNYLYNGAKYPALPELDGKKYAVISDLSLVVNLYLSNKKPYIGKNGQMQYDIGTEVYIYHRVSDGWNYANDNPAIWGETSGVSKPIWANAAIYYADDYQDPALAGTLYLAASDPIPVLNPTAILMGFLTGAKL